MVVMPVVVMHVHMHVVMAVVAPVMAMATPMMVTHRLGRSLRIGNRLHGHLGDRRAPHERRDGERRYGNAWKLHVFSLVVDNSPDS